MLLLLVHHGDAVGPDVDPQRPLSPRGCASVPRLAAEVASRGVRPDAIWHSGKLRARQTAEEFWRACHPLAAVDAVRGLLPDDPPGWMRDRLAGETRTLMLVGHMPHLGRLLRLLVEGDERASVAFPPHGVVALEVDADGTYVERWRLDAPA